MYAYIRNTLQLSCEVDNLLGVNRESAVPTCGQRFLYLHILNMDMCLTL